MMLDFWVMIALQTPRIRCGFRCGNLPPALSQVDYYDLRRNCCGRVSAETRGPLTRFLRRAVTDLIVG
jgi:hypothetical protein